MTDLATLIDIVQAKQSSGDWAYGAHRLTGERIALELGTEHGARIKTGDPYTMVMAGVRASCTGGYSGLFSNWQNAARRRLAQKEAGQ